MQKYTWMAIGTARLSTLPRQEKEGVYFDFLFLCRFSRGKAEDSHTRRLNDVACFHWPPLSALYLREKFNYKMFTLILK